MTNALLDITTAKKPRIYFLAGNNVNLDSYMYAFKQNLKAGANEVEDLDLLTAGKVPDDCDVLILTTLNTDLKNIERDAILNYIKKGGKIALFSDANVTKTKMPNFQKVLDEYGVSISEGILLEQDSKKMLSNSPSAILVTVESGTSITENILRISALNKYGIDELYEKIAELFNLNEINLDNEILITNIRHKNIISKSLENVNKAKEALEINMPIDIITIYIKEILEDLGEITGEVVTEDIINEIFSKFCLGK